MYRFRLLSGVHIEPDATRPSAREAGKYDRSADGNVGRRYLAAGMGGYRPGMDLIETETNLLTYNKPGVTPKYALADERLSAETTWDPKVETLDAFSVRMKTMLKEKAEAAVPGASEAFAESVE